VTTILIVEDTPALRSHITALIKEKIDSSIQVVETDNGVIGVAMAAELCPDLIVMDILMPQMNGIKAAQQIWSQKPTTKILFWSQFHRESFVREISKILPDEAIHGYALKSEKDEKLLYAINSILLHNNPYIDPLVRKVEARLKCRDQSLTDVEYETMLDIALGLTDRAIATRRHISVRGVQNRLSLLLTKLIGGKDAHLKETAGVEIFNPRTRIVLEALKREIIDVDDLSSMDTELDTWLGDEFDYEPQNFGRSKT
jgi:DNA-binding NarL/FixJ family response regulator